MARRPNTKTTPEVNPLLGTDNTFPEPPTDPSATPSGWVDNPLNPRGIPSNLCDGAPDSQATDAQKAQNPTPQRAPIATNIYPDPFYERVSAGQNRKPPQEIIP
jgi:hypothetical protein